jgi:hypothetical protein
VRIIEPEKSLMSDIERVRANVLAELEQRPGRRSWRTDATGLLALNLGIAATAVIGAVRLVDAPLEWRWWSVAPLVLTVIVASLFALRPGARIAGVVVGALAVSASVVLLASAEQRGVGARLLGDPECAAAELGVSLLPAIGMLVALRRFAYQPLRAALGGLGVGATGLLVLDVTCPMAGAGHVLVFHLVPCLFVIVALVVARSRLRSQSYVS